MMCILPSACHHPWNSCYLHKLLFILTASSRNRQDVTRPSVNPEYFLIYHDLAWTEKRSTDLCPPGHTFSNKHANTGQAI